MEAWPDVSRADIVRAADSEHARDLVGILFRRTGLGWYVRIPDDKVREAAELAAPALGWDAAAVDRAVEDYRAYVREHHMIGVTDWSA